MKASENRPCARPIPREECDGHHTDGRSWEVRGLCAVQGIAPASRVLGPLGPPSRLARSVAVLIQGGANLRVVKVAGGHHERVDRDLFGHRPAGLNIDQQLDGAIAHLERILHDEGVKVALVQRFFEGRAVVEAHEPRPRLRRQVGEGAQRAEGGEVRGREDGVDAAGVGRQRGGDRGLRLADAVTEIGVDDQVEPELLRRVDEPGLARRRRDDVRRQPEDADFGPFDSRPCRVKAAARPAA